MSTTPPPPPATPGPVTGPRADTPAGRLAASRSKLYWPVAAGLVAIVLVNGVRLVNDGIDGLALLVALPVVLVIVAWVAWYVLRGNRQAQTALAAEGITWSVPASVPAATLRAAGSWTGRRTPGTPIRGALGSDGTQVVWVPSTAKKKAHRLAFQVADLASVETAMLPNGPRTFPAMVFYVGAEAIPVPAIAATTPAKLVQKIAEGPLAHLFGA